MNLVFGFNCSEYSSFIFIFTKTFFVLFFAGNLIFILATAEELLQVMSLEIACIVISMPFQNYTLELIHKFFAKQGPANSAFQLYICLYFCVTEGPLYQHKYWLLMRYDFVTVLKFLLQINSYWFVDISFPHSFINYCGFQSERGFRDDIWLEILVWIVLWIFPSLYRLRISSPGCYNKPFKYFLSVNGQFESLTKKGDHNHF